MIPYRKLKWLFVFFGFLTYLILLFLLRFGDFLFCYIYFSLATDSVLCNFDFDFSVFRNFLQLFPDFVLFSGLFAFGASGMVIVSSDNIHSISIVC